MEEPEFKPKLSDNVNHEHYQNDFIFSPTHCKTILWKVECISLCACIVHTNTKRMRTNIFRAFCDVYKAHSHIHLINQLTSAMNTLLNCLYHSWGVWKMPFVNWNWTQPDSSRACGCPTFTEESNQLYVCTPQAKFV